jgi:hypothetical protein
MTNTLATTEAQPGTRFCPGCQTHKAPGDFWTPTTLHCKDCNMQTQKAGQLAQRQGKVAELFRGLKTVENDDVSTEQGIRRIIKNLGGGEKADRLISDYLIQALGGESLAQKHKAAVFMWQARQDVEAKRGIRDYFAELSDEQVSAIGFEIIARAGATPESLSLLEELAAKLGYRLVRDEAVIEGTAVIDGSAAPQQEAGIPAGVPLAC